MFKGRARCRVLCAPCTRPGFVMFSVIDVLVVVHPFLKMMHPPKNSPVPPDVSAPRILVQRIQHTLKGYVI